MQATYRSAFDNLEILIDKFEKQQSKANNSCLNETETRIQYINPFFEALGWDISNNSKMPQSYQDVIHEDRIEIEGKIKAPDYCFRIKGKRKFFVEAKKPKTNINENKYPAYQLRRYGWNANLPISILTDFEEFAIYDCTKKPSNIDNASTQRLHYIKYSEYIDKFDFLWNTFSKDSVIDNSIEQFAKLSENKKGTENVDDDFLKSLNNWRNILANNIFLHNSQLNDEELNYALQKIIDRILFLRICEARGVEPDDQLKKTLNKINIYDELKIIFHTADQKYNSGLFDYNKDIITDKLLIDNNTLKHIIENLYYPNSPYEFSIMPVEVMGHSYEQYLGSIVKKTPKGIIIEPKPEVRKAGGVYYTPQYIVNYIVENTIGKLLEGKTPKDVANMKICDPACGSGSFLIGAYDYLLNWHLGYYTNNQTKDINKYLTPDGNLTTTLKKQILLNNIFGVDIDSNAVEITKLSLMLKAIENETNASIQNQLTFLHEKVLPTFDDNIKSGNSLISTDFYDKQIDFKPEIEKIVKPFNWEYEFKEVFKNGGFDAIIGNPPYVRFNLLDLSIKKYLLNHYTCVNDLFSIFIEKSISLIKNNSLFSFIIPSLFIKGVKYDTLRKLFNRSAIEFQLKEYGDKVFEKVKMPTSIFIIKKGINNNIDFFSNQPNCTFNKPNIVNLEDISFIRRGLEIGRNKLKDNGDVICLTGGDINSYIIKKPRFIDKDTYNCFSKNIDIFKSPKIMIRETGDKFYATIDFNNSLTNRSIYNLQITNKNYNIYLILAIINSKLMKYYYSIFIKPDTNIFPKLRIIQLKKLPIPSNPTQAQQTSLITLVDEMLKLNEELQNTSFLPEVKARLEARIAHTDNNIDNLVYELYELTEEEIKIVGEISH